LLLDELLLLLLKRLDLVLNSELLERISE